jgi:hypothetical protein
MADILMDGVLDRHIGTTGGASAKGRLNRLWLRLRAVRLLIRRDHQRAKLHAELDHRTLIDIGVDARPRRYDWIAALMRRC